MSDHYQTLDWIGFTRGAAEPARAQAMQSHLDGGCEACQAEHQFWALLARTFAADREPVPESWLQRIAAAPRRLPRQAPEPTRFSLRLGFDNFAFAGAAVRGLKTRRHCVYHLKPGDGRELDVEIMVERVNSRSGWSVVGQILAGDGAEWRSGSLQLSRDGADACNSHTDAAGEFSFVRKDTGPWQLRLFEGNRMLGVIPVVMP